MKLKRRDFLRMASATTATATLGSKLMRAAPSSIDRKQLVERHKIVITSPDALSPLSVGNGEMVFTADITGLQTFPDFHDVGMPLHTMAQWAWHESSTAENYKLSDVMENYDSHGILTPYPSAENTAAGKWLMSNPHRFDLGRLSLIPPEIDGRPMTLADVEGARQELDLWNGSLSSRFYCDGHLVEVETRVHPNRDVLSIRIVSPLIRSKRLGIRMNFPGSPADWRNPGNWKNPQTHTTTASLRETDGDFTRQFDHTTITYAHASWGEGTHCRQSEAHIFEWHSGQRDTIELSIAFGAHPLPEVPPLFGAVKVASDRHWNHFWSTGGAIDLSASSDPRWKELERRIVLSQYQTAINSAGSLPPQETGLVTNSWFGKFHLEMHWWHAAHFALWGREALFMKSLDYYRQILPVARETAARIGCKGARWPKMVGPCGRESPNGINPFLVWEQPHPIHYAELMYQANPSLATLEFFRDIVLESAEFMASFAWWNSERKVFELGSPIVSAQEDGFPSRRTAKTQRLRRRTGRGLLVLRNNGGYVWEWIHLPSGKMCGDILLLSQFETASMQRSKLRKPL